jgi:hypothetical protein
MDTPVSGTPRLILRVEALAVLVASVVAYKWMHGSWLVFAVLLLAPDLSLAGYAVNARVGAVAYNVLHTYVAPSLLALVGALSGANVMPVCCIWVAHIAMDRALGLGLKFPLAFEYTHLGTVGRKSPPVVGTLSGVAERA